jgi:hypothetical protein
MVAAGERAEHHHSGGCEVNAGLVSWAQREAVRCRTGTPLVDKIRRWVPTIGALARLCRWTDFGASLQLLQRDIIAAIGGIADVTRTSRKRRE